MVAKTRALVPKDKLLLAGSGCEGTLATMRMCDEMANAGADALMVVSPGYYKAVLNDRALIYHFTAVADQSPLPVILYTVPACTGVELSVSAVATLCQHPNIVGMKDSTGDITKLASFVAVSKGEQFQVLGGSAGFLLAALSVGCSGAVCALGNLLPHQVCQLYQYFTRSNSPSETPPCNEDSKQQVSLGDKFTASQKEHELLPSGSSNGKQTSLENKIECARKALQLQHELLAPNTAVTKTFGIAGLKQAMDWMGYYGGPARKPLMPLLDADRQALRNIFVKSGFLKD
uniref:4-hydroxy-2-oxoglutarate aldolase n=1 Tax=Hirondellea gigas TaxID=1518452 RepID=A0A2P2I1F3_9CRUS